MHLPSPSYQVLPIPTLSQQTEDTEAEKRLSRRGHVWKLLTGDMAGRNCHHVLTPELMSCIPPEQLYRVRQETPLGQVSLFQSLTSDWVFLPVPLYKHWPDPLSTHFRELDCILPKNWPNSSWLNPAWNRVGASTGQHTTHRESTLQYWLNHITQPNLQAA